MKITSLILLLVCIQLTAWCQLSGKLINANRQPVQNASIQLLRATDSTVIKVVVSDQEGNFTINNTQPGNYYLRISCIGYHSFTTPVSNSANMNFGTLTLEEQSKQLQEVVVRAGKPVFQQKPEGLTVNVENSILSKGSTVLDILLRSPGISVDYRNNNITLNGKNGVQVMINGRPQRLSMEQLMQLLNGMSGNDVEKIELLTTPSVQYDAEGNAGLINIVLKKNRKAGTHGSLSLTGGYGWGEKGAASLQLAHNTKKLHLYGSYSWLYDRAYSNMYIDSWQHMPALGGDLHVIVWDTSHATQNNHDITTGMDLKLNSNTTIGGGVSFNRSTRATTDYNFLHYIKLPDSLSIFDGLITGTNRWKNVMGNMYTDATIRPGERLRVNVDYLFYKNNNPTTITSIFKKEDGTPAGNNDSLFAPSQRGFAHTSIRVGIAKLDYTRQLTTKWKMEAGVKGAFTQSLSESGIESIVNGAWVSRSETIAEIDMKEAIGAAYISFTAQLNAASNLVIGARYEYLFSDMKDPLTKARLLQRKQGVFFPGLSFTRKLNEHSELQLSWTKRISRPSYSDLASFVRYADPSAVFTGNPLLKPTITNNIKLGYNYDQYTFSLLFSRDDQPIARNMLTESPQRNLLYVSPQNLAWQKYITLQANIPVTVTKWWTMNYSFTGGWRQFRVVHVKVPVTKNYFGWNANASQSFQLPRRYMIELSGWYNAVSYSGTVKLDGFGAVNAGIKKELKKNGGSFQLSVTNLLRTMQIHSYFGAVAEEVYNIKNHVAFNVESRVFPVVKLTYTRSFGTTGTNAIRKPTATSNEERDRITNE